ncbi:hypothetical protein R1flu_010438 [Riccia fluitans]|uniref:Uncharacterized protein n=1 Tax=Riccia fluitans TaxID=41844 RepID=A0ABD1Z4Z2_9MARC
MDGYPALVAAVGNLPTIVSAKGIFFRSFTRTTEYCRLERLPGRMLIQQREEEYISEIAEFRSDKQRLSDDVSNGHNDDRENTTSKETKPRPILFAFGLLRSTLDLHSTEYHNLGKKILLTETQLSFNE